MNQPNDSTQQQWQALSRNILRMHQASARRDAVRHAEYERGGKNKLETAKKVDELVRSPKVMQHWRKKITSTFERSEVRNVKNRIEVGNVWWKLLDNINLDTHVDVLYTLLAFCHDDQLRMNRIITDELKRQSPLLCEDICVYYRRGVPQVLDVYLSYVKRDIEVKTNLFEQPSEIGRNAAPAKEWWITTLFKNIIEKGWQIFTKSFWDSVFERWGPK